MAGQRLKNEADPYNKGYHRQAWINSVVKIGSPATLVGVAAAATGATIPMLATIATIIAAVEVTNTWGQSMAEDLRHKLKR